MQKRISFVQILQEINAIYAPLWTNILSQIKYSSPILCLQPFGSIVFIENSLYLIIGDDLLHGLTAIKPMITLQQYFIKPYNSRLNVGDLTKLQSYVIKFFIDYVKRMIPLHGRSVYRHVIDFNLLGQLTISKSVISFQNGLNQWKYERKVQRIELPRLMTLEDNGNQRSIEKMARTLSLQMKRQPKSESKGNKVNLRRSISMSRIQASIQALQPSISHQQKPILKQLFQKNKKNKSKLTLDRPLTEPQQQPPNKKISTEPTQTIAATPFKIKTEDKFSKSSFVRSRSKSNLPSKQKSRNKYEQPSLKSKNIKIKLPSQKNKLTLSRQTKQTLLPRQREKMLKIEDVYQKQRQRNAYEFVERSTIKCLSKQAFKNVQKHKIQQYMTQLCKIYLNKQQEVRQLRLDNVMLLKAQKKRYKKMSQLQLHKFCNLIKCITPQEQLIFNQYFKLVQTYRSAFKKLTLEYYIVYAKHYQLMEQCVSSLQRLNNRVVRVVVSQQLKIRIALLLNNLYQCIRKIQGELLDAIIIRKEKFISISVCSETSFPNDIQKTAATFSCIFQPLISFIRINYPSVLHLQQHQTSNIQLCRIRLLELMSNCQSLLQQNLSKFKTTANKNLILTVYSTEKQSIALIGKMYVLREQLESELDFKGYIAKDGVSINMLKVKQYYLYQLDRKLFELYQFLKKIYDKSESELNMRLKAIVSINVDYLNDYKCKEYKENIEENYKNLVDCIMMIINELRPQSKGLQMQYYLEIALNFKQKIRQNFSNFDAKVQEYRNISIKTIRLLQTKNKDNKQILRQLTKKLKLLLQSLANERSILQSKIDIMSLEEQYNSYCIQSKNLIAIMKENDMVYWEDDSFFPTHMQLLKSSLQFLESKNYKTLFNTPLYELTFEQFLSAYQQFDEFITNFKENRLQKLFKPAHSLLQQKLTLIETALYKGYTQVDLQKARQIGLDLQAEKSSKIFVMVKRYQSLQKKKQEKLLELYQQARLTEFQLGQNSTCKHIKVQQEEGEFGTSYIGNLQQLKNEIQRNDNAQAHSRLIILEETISLYNQVLLFHRIINLITNCNLKHENKMAMQQEINVEYCKLLNLHVQLTTINRFKNKIQIYKCKYMEILYIEKIKVFPQYCLVNIQKLIELSNWQTAYRIRTNICHLFEDIDEVQIVNEGSISCLVLGRDKIHLEKTINVWQKQGDKSKQVHMHICNLMREGIEHSEFTCTSIKILIWSIYYTQQVQLNLMTDVPLSQLKTRLLQIINQIASQIRYDLNTQHISFEITQLQAFLNHLQKIINLQTVTDYEWTNTLRFYEKLKVIRVEQNGRAYQYGFQPKKPMNFDPTFQLQTSTSYGLSDCSTYYQLSSFIIGQPYRTFDRLSDYGFQKQHMNLLKIIKKYKFYIRIIVDAVNCKIINYLHKNILQFRLKKLKENEEQTLGLPIFFQYKGEQDISACFSQKMRKFSVPQLSYSLNIVVRLRLNKWQQKLDSLNINMEVICKALTYIGSNKKLSMKKVIQFIDSLQKFLEERQHMPDIYKFCFKYFLVNFQIQDNQLSIILQNLMIKKEQLTLNSQSQRIIQLLNAYKNQNQSLKHHLIIYGDTSTKTYSIQRAGIPYYNSQQTSQSLIHIEGINSFLAIKTSDTKLTGRFVIQDRYIWDIDPVDLADNALHYVNQLDGDSVELIFKQRIARMQVEGNYKKLWTIMSSLHEIYCSLSTGTSFLAMMNLILRVFSKDIDEFINQLQPQTRKDYRVGINKDIITVFLVITHEMYFYLLQSTLRKQFSERVRQLPSLLDYRSEDLPSLTFNGTNYEKIVSLIKKQKKIHSNIGNYMKQLILIKKYLKYNQTVVIQYSNSVMLNLIKDSFNDLQEDRMNLTTEVKHLNIIKTMRYKKMLYVVDELHLAHKKQITFLKTHQEHHHNSNYKYILMSRDRNYVKALSTHVTFKYQELDIDQIFKYQTKSGINDVILQRSKLLKANCFFINQAQFLSFMFNTTIKLPSQYYNKYYARLLIFNKLALQQLATTVFVKIEKYLKETISITSQGVYLSNSKGTHQQINELQINSRIERSLQKFSFLEQTIIKDYYKVMLPYMLADRIYIIREDVQVLPVLISTMHDRKHYELCNRETFAKQLISIIEDNYKQDREFTVVFKEPLSTSAQCYYFLLHYLKGFDIISLYNQFQQFTEMLTKKQEFVYRLANQQIAVMKKINNILYRNMKLIIQLTKISQFDTQICSDYSDKIVCLNCQLDEESRGRVASVLYSKIVSQQTQFHQQILKQHQVIILGLVKTNLIDLGRFETFLLVLIDNITEENTRIESKQQLRIQKRILLNELIRIKNTVGESLNLQKVKLQQLNQLLSDIMKKIDQYKKQEKTSILGSHNQNLIKLKNAFMGSDVEINVQLDSHPKYQSFYQLLRQIYFQDQLTQIEQYPFFNINSNNFLELMSKVEVRATLIQACEGEGEQLSRFILHRYLKYMLKILEEYDNIKPTVDMVGQEVRQINYFYLIDVAIDFKKKCHIIEEQYSRKQNQNRIFDSIISSLVQLQHLLIDQKFISNDSLSTRIKRVIKNNSIEFDSFHINTIIQTQIQSSSKIMSEFDEYILKQSQSGFQQFCKDLLKQDTNLIIYDPYWRIQSFCASIDMDVVYVCNESDLIKVHEYRFVPTIFCILLPTIDSYYQDRQLIDACQQIMLKKHNDLSQNGLEKLVLWITDRRLLTEMDYSYPIINLDYTLNKFIHFASENILNEQFQWSVLKKQYNLLKKQLLKEMELIKTLNREEILVYCLKLEQLVVGYQKLRQQLRSISQTQIIQPQWHISLEQIYSIITKFNSQIGLHFNLNMRLLKKANFIDILTKWGCLISSSPQQKSQFLKEYLLSIKSDKLLTQLEQCINQSRYIIVLYTHFNHKIIKEMLELEESGRYQLRFILQINPTQIQQFMQQSAFGSISDVTQIKQIVLFFVKQEELIKVKQLLPKCSVLRI